jgi:hypothetical protein
MRVAIDRAKKKLRHNKYMREVWYPRNRKKHIAYVRAAKRKKKRSMREFVNSLKDGPCTDCKNTFPPVAMDFDHLGNKSFGIGTAVVSCRSKAQILDEVKKCELVCSNCHRVRTEERRNKVVAAGRLGVESGS